MSKPSNKPTEALGDRKVMSTEDTQLRSEIFRNGLHQTADHLRRDSQFTGYIVAATQTLSSLGHPLAYHLMNDLAFNLTGKNSFTKGCAIVGVEVPPAVETATRKPRAKAPEQQQQAAA